MNNKLTVLIMLSVFLIATTLSGCITGQKTVEQKTVNIPGEGKVTVNTGSGWCQTGTKLTTKQGSFEIKGLTKHNGTDVCEAEYIYDQGSMVQYFNEKGDYMVMVYKDKNGIVTQEINTANAK